MYFKMIALIFAHLLIASKVDCKDFCPKICVCDIFEGQKRADCSEQQLVSPYTDVPNSVQILNLAGNDITNIDNDCFKDYQELINLSLQRNAINDLELYAFEYLEKLSFLDLSENRLEMIDNRIFERNEKLVFLDLSKNKFMSLKDQSLVICKSLEFLSLRNSQLSHIYDKFFQDLPNLKDLDLSNNLLITLRVESFLRLSSLEFVNLEYNRWNCDSQMEYVVGWFKKNRINAKMDKCGKNSKKPMFERMMEDPNLTTPEPREDIDIELVWGEGTSFEGNVIKSVDINDTDPTRLLISLNDYYSHITIMQDNHEICEEKEEAFDNLCDTLTTCQEKYIQLFDTKWKTKKYGISNVEVILFTGLIIGVFVGCILAYCCIIVRNCLKNNCTKIRNVNETRDYRRNDQTRLAESFVYQRQSPIPVLRSQNRESQLPLLPESSTLGRELNIAADETTRRSPIPAPRNATTDLSRNSSSANELQHLRNNNRRIQSTQLSYQYSPTAVLLQSLFKRRQPSRLSEQVGPSSSGVQISVTPSTPSAPNENVYSDIDIMRGLRDDDETSEYLSVSNLSVRSEEPPPPYKELFINSVTDVSTAIETNKV